MTSYVCLKILNDGVVGLSSTYGEQIFTVRKARKNVRHGCVHCTSAIEMGVLCWGPLTNGMNRMHRICGACIMTLIDTMLTAHEKARHP